MRAVTEAPRSIVPVRLEFCHERRGVELGPAGYGDFEK